MATFRRRPSGCWEAQVRKYGWPTQTRTFGVRSEAVAWAAVVESEMARGVHTARTDAAETTLDDLLRQYLEKITPQKKGRQSETHRINALLRDPLSQVSMVDLTGKRVAEWRDYRLEKVKVSGSTVNRDLNLLSHVINIARKEWGLVIENPVSLVRRPRRGKGRRRRLTAEEETKLLCELEPRERGSNGQLSAGTRNPWIRPLVILAIETAMRRSELLSLQWKDVSLEERYVHLEDTKNGESRDVPLSPRAFFVLSTLPHHPSGRVFPLTGEAVKRAFTRAVKRCGIIDFRFHDLRHEGTSRLATKLDNVLELGAVTGHKTLAMLNRYYHPHASELAKKLSRS